MDCYYLHENGQLISKKDPDISDLRESDFVVAFWPIDRSDRLSGWCFLVEALASGASKEDVDRIAEHWNCNDHDAQFFASKIGVNMKKNSFSSDILVNVIGSKITGEGNTALKAFSELAIRLGYKPEKLWPVSFIELVENEAVSN